MVESGQFPGSFSTILFIYLIQNINLEGK